MWQEPSLNLSCSSLTFANGLTIYYTEDLEGGGVKQHKDFLNVLSKLGKNYHSCLEWCAGHGAIGFSLLDSKYCTYLHLMEKYEPAYYVNLLNISYNNLKDHVTVQCCNSVNKISKGKKFDLVVSNPPHSPEIIEHHPLSPEIHNNRNNRICVDLNWEIHDDFFNNIKYYLNPGADVLLSEIHIHQHHIDCAETNGLKFINNYPAPELSQTGGENSYIMHYRYL